MSKSKFFAVSSFLLLSFCVHAAGPITHVALGEMWLANVEPNYSDEQKKLFLLGTVFPDIRYLGVIRRDQTHYKGVTLEQIKNTHSAFKQGMLFHSYVDEFREKWVRKHKIEKQLLEIPPEYKHIFMKIIEDQIIFYQYSWSNFRQALLTIPAEEREYKIEDKALNEWHTGLALYFTASPGVLLSQIGFLEKNISNLPAATVKQWGLLLPDYTAEQKMQEYVQGMMHAFEEAIKKQG